MIEHIDWLEDFERRFNKDILIQQLKKNKFHGSLTLNFHEGLPVNCDMKKHIKAVNTNQP